MLHALDVIIQAIAAFINETVKGIQLIFEFTLQMARALAFVQTLLTSIPVIFTVAAGGILSLLFVINILNKGG